MCIHNLCHARYCEGKKQGVRTATQQGSAVLYWVLGTSEQRPKGSRKANKWLANRERTFETEEMASAKPPRQAEVWNVQGTEGAKRSVWLEGRELENGSGAQVLPMGPQGHGKRL